MRHMRDAEAKSQQALFDEESISWLDFGKRKESVRGEGQGLGHILSVLRLLVVWRTITVVGRYSTTRM